MKIIVVKSPDGDWYFRGDRNAEKARALNAAVEFAIRDEKLDSETREKIKKARLEKRWNTVWSLVVDCGQLRERVVFSKT